MSDGMGQSGWNEVEIKPGQCGDSKQVLEEWGRMESRREVGPFQGHKMGLIPWWEIVSVLSGHEREASMPDSGRSYLSLFMFLGWSSISIASFMIRSIHQTSLPATLCNPSDSQYHHFSPEDGDSTFLQNVCIYWPVHTVPEPRKTSSLSSPPRKPQISHSAKPV
jgi:hypothetical protein